VPRATVPCATGKGDRTSTTARRAHEASSGDYADRTRETSRRYPRQQCSTQGDAHTATHYHTRPHEVAHTRRHARGVPLSVQFHLGSGPSAPQPCPLRPLCLFNHSTDAVMAGRHTVTHSMRHRVQSPFNVHSGARTPHLYKQLRPPRHRPPYFSAVEVLSHSRIPYRVR